MPVYNAKPFLERSISSVLMQEEVDELICIDDGSTDGSFEFLQSWALKDYRIRLFHHPGRVRKRAAASRNLGLKYVKGDYIAFLDADDEFLKDRFAFIKSQTLSGKELDVCLANVMVMFADGRNIIASISSSEPMLAARQILLNPANNPIPNINGLVLSASMIKKVGFFDESLIQKEDKDYMLRAFLSVTPSKVCLVNQIAAVYHQHDGSTSTLRVEHYEDSNRWYLKWLNESHFPFSQWTRLKFIWQYMVVKYRTDTWGKSKKLMLYPFLYLSCVIKHF